jgi:hypothetical protein
MKTHYVAENATLTACNRTRRSAGLRTSLWHAVTCRDCLKNQPLKPIGFDTFYIAAITRDGQTISQCHYGLLPDAERILQTWIDRGEDATNKWDKPLIFASISSTKGLIARYAFKCDPTLPDVVQL